MNLNSQTLACHTTFSKKLNSPLSEIQVQRVRFDKSVETITSGIPAWAILKSLPQHLCSGKRPPSFLEELVNYQFLTTVREDFPYFPKLYLSNENVMLLEDLGPDEYAYADIEEFSERLAETMTSLHCATVGKEAEYLAMRSNNGLPEEDLRVWSVDEQNAFFDIGLDCIKQIDTMHPTLPILLEAKKTVNNPGVFRSFIHDDIAARRQTVSTTDALYFIDFETGKYAHCLLDVVKPILGKVERKRRSNCYFLNNPGLPLNFSNAYYDKVVSTRGNVVGKETWECHLYACFLFITVANIGLAIRVDQFMSATTNLNTVFVQILVRLLSVLSASSLSQIIKIYEPIQRTIQQFQQNVCVLRVVPAAAHKAQYGRPGIDASHGQLALAFPATIQE